MDSYLIAVIFLLIVSFISRAISSKATEKLSQEKKALLIDLFSKTNIYTYGVLIVIIILYFMSLKYQFLDLTTSMILYVIIVLLFVVVTSYLAHKKLKKNNFPEDYIKSYLISSSIKFLGLIVFFLLLNTSRY